jgi:2',3'-cyclic-nucleotide 2'-phosphodiesterase (5'-nucleotidase family)
MIKKWKGEQRDLLILDAGDLLYPKLSEPPSEDQETLMKVKAKGIVAAFNYMGCDTVTIGEDDLLWGKENLLQVLKEATFAVVSANLIDRKSGDPFFAPYVIKQMHGYRVGIFGLFSMPDRTIENRLKGLTVLEPFQLAPQIVSTLREKTDFVILLSQLGYAKDLELARKVKGISLIVGGETGINLTHPRIIQDSVVLQVGSKGRYLGRIDVKIVDPSQPMIDVARKGMLKRRLNQLEARLNSLDGSVAQDSVKKKRTRDMLERQRAETLRVLASYEGRNEIVNRIVALRDKIPVDAECMKILEPYLLQLSAFEERSRPPGPSTPGSPEKASN